ncbi:MAG TPA: protein-L-isoaspartate(D-aspartate) O-methyltransferase [Blastocatellia bacterium]|nr:protein-L-isoaspartate(D-aspartate) O-methyltransferase [Blastocatellia bacterium]
MFTPLAPNDDPYALARQRMVERLRQKGIRDERVLAAMATVPRHLFVEEALWHRAYEDHALPIGYGQTISQPYMVALMTELLRVQPGERVLEIGAGSGYQTAILAVLGAEVYAVERIPELAQRAQARLEALGITTARVRASDGTLGWPEAAPFDAILVAAGSPAIPRPLVDQLIVGGRLVIPVGDETQQDLVRLWKGETENKIEYHGGCIFVKLIGAHGWSE